MTEPVVNPFVEILRSRQYTKGYIPPEEDKLFLIQDQLIGSLQSFVVFSGLPKSGKSTYLTALVSSLITGHECFSMKLQTIPERPVVAYFDTESSIVDFYKHIDRIKKFAKVDELPDYIKPYCTRQDTPKQQKKLIETHFSLYPDTSILFIDGLLDLCMNYNDETESRELINWLKRMSVQHNILIITVLHTGKDGMQRLGHLGANTDRWSQSTLTVKKEEDKFILEAKMLRSSAGFTPIELVWDKDTNGYIMYNQGEIQSKNHYKYYSLYQHNDRLNLIYQHQNQYGYDEFIGKLKDIEKRGTNYCKEYFALLKQKELIKQNFENKWIDNRVLF